MVIGRLPLVVLLYVWFISLAVDAHPFCQISLCQPKLKSHFANTFGLGATAEIGRHYCSSLTGSVNYANKLCEVYKTDPLVVISQREFCRNRQYTRLVAAQSSEEYENVLGRGHMPHKDSSLRMQRYHCDFADPKYNPALEDVVDSRRSTIVAATTQGPNAQLLATALRSKEMFTQHQHQRQQILSALDEGDGQVGDICRVMKRIGDQTCSPLDGIAVVEGAARGCRNMPAASHLMMAGFRQTTAFVCDRTDDVVTVQVTRHDARNQAYACVHEDTFPSEQSANPLSFRFAPWYPRLGLALSVIVDDIYKGVRWQPEVILPLRDEMLQLLLVPEHYARGFSPQYRQDAVDANFLKYGVPPSLRGPIWLVLSHRWLPDFFAPNDLTLPQYYSDLVRQAHDIRLQCVEGQLRNSDALCKSLTQIAKDSNRVSLSHTETLEVVDFGRILEDPHAALEPQTLAFFETFAAIEVAYQHAFPNQMLYGQYHGRLFGTVADIMPVEAAFVVVATFANLMPTLDGTMADAFGARLAENENVRNVCARAHVHLRDFADSMASHYASCLLFNANLQSGFDMEIAYRTIDFALLSGNVFDTSYDAFAMTIQLVAEQTERAKGVNVATIEGDFMTKAGDLFESATLFAGITTDNYVAKWTRMMLTNLRS